MVMNALMGRVAVGSVERYGFRVGRGKILVAEVDGHILRDRVAQARIQCIGEGIVGRIFMGAASVGAAGLMQADIILVGAERRLMDRADEIIVLVDSSKFDGPSGHVVCPLQEIDIVVTDGAVSAEHVKMLERAGVRLVIARE